MKITTYDPAKTFDLFEPGPYDRKRKEERAERSERGKQVDEMLNHLFEEIEELAIQEAGKQGSLCLFVCFRKIY